MEEDKPKYFYQATTASGRLERYLINKGVTVIGDMNYMIEKYGWLKRIDADPLWRAVTRYAKHERAVRTILIKQLTKEAIDRIHKKELKNGSLYCMMSQRRAFIDASMERVEHIELEGDDFGVVEEFDDKWRPILEESYDGFHVPPYFIYNCNFDGILYQHTWDWNVWTQILEMTRRKPKTLAEAVERMVE